MSAEIISMSEFKKTERELNEVGEDSNAFNDMALRVWGLASELRDEYGSDYGEIIGAILLDVGACVCDIHDVNHSDIFMSVAETLNERNHNED